MSDDSIKTLAQAAKLHKAVIVWKVMSVSSSLWWNQQWSIPWISPKERPKRNVKNKGNEQTAVAFLCSQPQPTHAQFVVLAGAQSLSKQEKLKLAKQSKVFRGCLCMHDCRVGRAGISYLDRSGKTLGAVLKTEPFAIRWVTRAWTAFSFPSVQIPSYSQALPWSPTERHFRRHLSNLAIA